jgi:predicted phosphodiesterase
MPPKGQPGVRSRACEVVRQWLADHPEVTEKRTAARLIYKAHPKLFTDVENCRAFVRDVTGQRGKERRASNVDKTLYRKAGKQSDAKIVIPEGASEFKQPIEIKGPCKVLVMGDLHIPYHDKRAVETALNYAVKHGCDTLYLNGDCGDYYGISDYDKDPENRDMPGELDVQEQILDILKPLFKTKYLKCGNHDARWEKYIFRNAPELGRVAKVRLPKILELAERGYEWVDNKQWSIIGRLPILHGHEVNGSSPVNAARGAYLKANNTIAVGHHHRTSQHVETQSLTQTQIVTWSIGCLCNLRPAYAPINKWNLGFAIIDVDSDGSFEFTNLRIDHTNNYKIYR